IAWGWPLHPPGRTTSRAASRSNVVPFRSRPSRLWSPAISCWRHRRQLRSRSQSLGRDMNWLQGWRNGTNPAGWRPWWQDRVYRALTYYQRLLWMALRDSWSLAETVVGVVTGIAAVISLLFWRNADNIVSQSASLITTGFL